MELEIGHAAEGEFDVLSPKGELDLSTYTQLRGRIQGLIAQGRVNLVLDLTGTDFLDSTALGALIGGRRAAHVAGGSFAIVAEHPQLLKLFAITKLDLVFTVHPSLQAWRERWA